MVVLWQGHCGAGSAVIQGEMKKGLHQGTLRKKEPQDLLMVPHRM